MKSEDVRRIEVEKLDPNPFQPRIEYPERDLKVLAESITRHGVIQPIIVRPKGDRFEVVVGWGRVLASRLAGIKEIPAIVKDLTDEQNAAYAMIENLQRRDLNPIEEARGFKTLHERFGWTQEGIAKELGRGLTRDVVAQRIRLLTFPAELQALVSRDTITPTHAEALARLSNEPSLLKEAIATVVKKKLNTRETEQLIEELTGRKGGREFMQAYVTSPEFLLLLRIIFASLQLDHLTCPNCYGSADYDDSNDMPRIFCNDCGWSLDVSLLTNGKPST